ncbi:MAG: universal stress protein [Altererythrobacter sp.]|nr:universal stress protein [Altererythrobacter sp.]
MSDAANAGAPKTVLLATDLSCRCDRALDRAIRLSERWDARLVVAHVLAPAPERPDPVGRDVPAWYRTPDRVESARWRIGRDLGSELAHAEVRVEEGDPAERLLAIAEQEACDLIVTGVAREAGLGRMLIGTTINQLVRRSSVPVLVVKDRAASPYHHIAVATNFSDASRHALETTAAFFPTADIVLLHGYDLPYGGLHDKTDVSRRMREMEDEQGADFLASVPIDDALRKRIRVLIEQGNPERLIWEYVSNKGADLTVIGSHGRGALFDILIGSMTKRLLESAAGDLLVVIQPPAEE